MSLFIPLWSQILVIENCGMAINYGLNKVLLTATLADATDLGDGAIQVTVDATMECESSDKPVCIAQMVHRYLPH